MFKLGLVIAVFGVVAFLVGGGFMAYSQTRSKGAEVLTSAFEALQTPMYAPVVARVNGADIPGDKLQLILALYAAGHEIMPGYYQALEAQGVKDEPPKPREVLARMITSELIDQEAGRRGLRCTEDEARKVAEDQLGLAEQADPSLLEAWADHLSVSVDQLIGHPDVVGNYSRLCAGSKLWKSVLPEELLRTNRAAARQMWEDFVQSLKEVGDIEILDGRLQ